METAFRPKILVLLLFSLLMASCSNSVKDTYSFKLKLGNLDDQAIIPVLEGSLHFKDQPAEELINIPDDLDEIRYSYVQTSLGTDSLTTIVSGLTSGKDVVYVIDANSNEDLSDDEVLMFTLKNGIYQAEELVYGEKGESPLIHEPTRLSITTRNSDKPEYHFNELWFTQLKLGSESLDVAIQRFAPDFAFLFIDINQSKKFDQIFFPSREKLSMNGFSFTVNVDFENELIHLSKTDPGPTGQ
ncbi:MAG: hypothetical protein HOK84_11325 [Bacteroidetes bacterium]|nr:hypothetical protein [Bacteroidota bacterium]